MCLHIKYHTEAFQVKTMAIFKDVSSMMDNVRLNEEMCDLLQDPACLSGDRTLLIRVVKQAVAVTGEKECLVERWVPRHQKDWNLKI